MNATQLTVSILHLAFQGRLSSQRNDDGSSLSLLAEIQAEKNRLCLLGQIKKKDVAASDIHEDDYPFDIPTTWCWCTIGDIFTHNNGKQLNRGNSQGKMMRYITTSNLYWDYFVLDNIKEMPFEEKEIERCQARKGDLLVCEGGDIGRASVWMNDYPIMLQNHIHKLRAFVPVCTRYFYYLFLYYNKTGQIGGKGIGIQGFSSSALHNTMVPLPPLEEQKRIVAKLDEILPLVEKYGKSQEALDKLNASLPQQLKASILQEAIQGKLVPQDPNDEPASELLARVREEKAKLMKVGKIKKEKPQLPFSDEGDLFELPHGWEWTNLGSLLAVVSDGTHQTPKYVESGVPFLSVQNISSGMLDMTNAKYISVEEHSKLVKRTVPQRGDILLCRIGTLGKAIEVTWEFDFSIFVSLGLLRPVDSSITPYLILLLNSPWGKQWIDKVKVGGGTHTYKINLTDIPSFPVPLPPFEEQKRIVAKLDELLPKIDSMEF